MKTDDSFLKNFLSTISAKTDSIRESLSQLKVDYSLSKLDALASKIRELENGARGCHYEETANKFHYYELDVATKAKNLHYSDPNEEWHTEFEKFLNETEKKFLLQQERMKDNFTSEGRSMKNEKKQVILVDDDDSLTKLLSFELHRLGFEVKILANGKEALNYLLREENLQDVFLVILDRMLPDMDGLDILQQFNSESPIKTPFIILSGLTSEEDILLGLQTGAIDYITKPFSVYVLAQKVLNLFKTQY